MAKVIFQGALKHRIKSYIAIVKISMSVVGRRLIGKPIAKDWSVMFEIGALFWRHQFDHAFASPNFQDGRDYFDSLITSTDETFAVTIRENPQGQLKGKWYLYEKSETDIDVLYLHGGGYAFRSEISSLYAETLAGLLGVNLFMPEYRLTPENPHPAQVEDALSAYRYMLAKGVDPKKMVIIGDSAGGHLVLMLLQALKKSKLPQPALAIGLCPWTDIGERGASLYKNDKYDLVQGYMAVKFGQWLRGDTNYSREDLSPIYKNYKGLAPLYLQGGGREVLIDMIRDFAIEVQKQGADVTLDVWPNMVHNFQAHGTTHPDSQEAFQRMKEAIQIYVRDKDDFADCPRTEVSSVK